MSARVLKTQYAIESDWLFNQWAITNGQQFLQSFLGKVLGPVLGMMVYSHHGQNGFVWLLLAFNALSTCITESLLPVAVSQECERDEEAPISESAARDGSYLALPASEINILADMSGLRETDGTSQN